MGRLRDEAIEIADILEDAYNEGLQGIEIEVYKYFLSQGVLGSILPRVLEERSSQLNRDRLDIKFDRKAVDSEPDFDLISVVIFFVEPSSD